jgi:hypothetical protein
VLVSAWSNGGGGGGGGGEGGVAGDDEDTTRWEMTGFTGTYRYMAPEVYAKKVCSSFWV